MRRKMMRKRTEINKTKETRISTKMKQTSGKVNQAKAKAKINSIRNGKGIITVDVVEI